MDYIVYSSGRKDYAFYEESEGFPQKIKAELERLYTKTPLLCSSEQKFSVGVRFAPINDCFVLSVFFKGITSKEEQRSHIAVVSWVLDNKEADSLLGDSRQTQFATLLANSKALLENVGYSIPEATLLSSNPKTDINADKIRSLYSALIFSSRAFTDTGYTLSNQVFMGIDTKKEGYFDALFVFLKNLPAKIRKKISFYVGAHSASDSYGVALTVFDDSVLSLIRSNNDFSGAMPVKKLIYTDGSLATTFVSCKEAEVFLGLNNVDLKFLGAIFENSEDFDKYLACAEKIQGVGVEFSQDFELLYILGDSLSLLALEKDFFSDSFLKTLYKEQKKLEGMPLFLSALNKRFGGEEKKKKGKSKMKFFDEKEKKAEFITDEPQTKESSAFLKKTAIFFSALLCFLAAVIIPVLLFLIGTNTVIAEKNMVISLDIAAFSYGLSLLILTLCELPLGYMLITLIKKLFKK